MGDCHVSVLPPFSSSMAPGVSKILKCCWLIQPKLKNFLSELEQNPTVLFDLFLVVFSIDKTVVLENAVFAYCTLCGPLT